MRIASWVSTCLLIALAYTAAAISAQVLSSPSAVWYFVLGADFLLVAFCTVLASVARNSDSDEVEIIGVGIGTIAPLGLHAVLFFVQWMSGDADAAKSSVIGAIVHREWPVHANGIYLGVLTVVSVLSGVVCVSGTLHVRRYGEQAAFGAAAVVLLAFASLFLLPWFDGQEQQLAVQSVTLSNALFVALLVGGLLFGAGRLFRALLGAMRLAVGAATALVPIAIALGAASLVIIFVGLVGQFLLSRSAGVLELLRLVGVALMWLAGGSALVAVIATVCVFLGRVALQVFVSARRRWRVSAVVAGSIATLLILFWPRHHPIPEPPSEEVDLSSVELTSVPVACTDLRWQYAEVDRLSAPLESCGAFADDNIWVVVGSATARGGPRSEVPRALMRGVALARRIAATPSTRVFVLNRGIEQLADERTKVGPRLLVLAGTVVPRGANLDDDTVRREIARYLAASSAIDGFSECELYEFNGQKLPLRPLGDACLALNATPQPPPALGRR